MREQLIIDRDTTAPAILAGDLDMPLIQLDRPDPGAGTYRANAVCIANALREDNELTLKKLNYDPDKPSSDTQSALLTTFTNVLDSGDDDTLATFGVDVRNTWFNEIAQVLAEGRSVTVGTQITPAVRVLQNEGTVEIYKPLFNQEAIAIALAGLLRTIAPLKGQVRPVVAVTDNTEPLIKSGHYLEYRDHSVGLGQTLYEAGVIQDNDISGKDFAIVTTEATNTDQVEALIARLEASRLGRIKQLKDKSIVFMPNSELLAIVPSITIDRKQSVLAKGIPLRLGRFGIPTFDAPYVASLLDVLDRQEMYIAANSNPTYRPDHIRLLSRAAGIAREDLHQVVRVNPRLMTPDLFRYTVGRLLERHVKDYQQSFGTYADFKTFDPKKYAESNYGLRDEEGNPKELLAEDKDYCKLLAYTFKFLGMTFESAAEIGPGPNPYPGMSIIKHLSPESTFELLEFSPVCREYYAAFLDGTLSPEDNAIWERLRDQLVASGGEIYQNAIEALGQAKQEGRITVEPGHILRLKKAAWDLITTFFVGDSFSPLKTDFRQSLRSLYEALTLNGILIAGYMLNKPTHKGYNAGQNTFPNISQDPEEIVRAHQDNDMYCVVVRLERDARSAREGYDGMVYVIACRNDSENIAKLRALKDDLKAQGREVYTVDDLDLAA